LVEESPSGQLHLKAGDAGGTDSWAGKYKTSWNNSLKEMTLKFRVKFDQLGNYGAEIYDGFQVFWGNGYNNFHLFFFKDQVRYLKTWAATYDTFCTYAFDNTSWYDIQIKYNSTPSAGSRTHQLYINGVDQGTKVAVDASVNNGILIPHRAWNYSASPTETEVHVEYTKAATGLYNPPVTSTIDIYKEGTMDESLSYVGVDADYVMPEPKVKSFGEVYAEKITTPEIETTGDVGLFSQSEIPESPYDSDLIGVMPEPGIKSLPRTYVQRLEAPTAEVDEVFEGLPLDQGFPMPASMQWFERDYWEDHRTPVNAVRVPAAKAPTWTAYGGGYILTFSDDAAPNEEEVYFTVQLPHSYKIGSDLYPHVHWVPEDGTAGVARWGLEYTWTNIDAAVGGTTTIYVNDTNLGADVHHLASFSAITGTGKEISSMLICRLFRNSDDAADTLNGKWIGFLEFDIHYKRDAHGSSQELIK